MSYDLQIWSAEPVALPPASDGWSAEGEAWLNSGRNRHITIWNSTPAESEDAPDDVAAAIPGLAWVTELNLHPFDAGPNAVAELIRIARKLAKPVRGAVYDPQADTTRPPPGTKRFVAPAKESPADSITMSWWFDRQTLPGPDGVRQLLDLFDMLLPEALPRRYGTFEPPEFRYDTGGRPALERFLNESDGYILWYPHPPVIDVDLLLPRPWGAFRDGFRSNHLSVAVDAAVLAQFGWERQLRKFWRAVSLFLQPFFGDVRTLRGYRRSGGRFYSHPSTTENHPVMSWFWAGLPPTIDHAAVIGEPYAGLWPGLAEIAEYDGGLAFLSARSWQGEDEAAPFAPAVPPEIVDPQPQPLHPRPGSAVRRLDRPYPKTWPFEAPFDPSRR
jgi:hypothetical protein